MTKFRLELFIEGNQVFRIIEADDVIEDGIGFIVFYKKTDEGEQEFVAEYNPAFIISLTREDD